MKILCQLDSIMLRSVYLIFVFTGFYTLCYSQWKEEFSGTAIDPSVWQGDLSHFIITPAQQARLNAPEAGSTRLYTLQYIPDSVQWDFYAFLDFSPSGSNLMGILLMGDDPDINVANGYYFEVGETGNGDAMRFYRLDNGQRTLLASGQAGAMGGNTAKVRGRMLRHANGEWHFLADYTGGNQLSEEFVIQETTHGAGKIAYFGLYCTYTATRTDKYYFDDIAINPIIPDSKPPVLLSTSVIDANELLLTFDEPIEEGSATAPELYALDHGLGMPALAEWSVNLPEQVRLVWTAPMVLFTDYTLKAWDVSDRFGNKSDTLSNTFTFILGRPPVRGELIINEIMADPTPPAGLPDAEFVELYNTSSAVIELKGMKITTSGSSANLPDRLVFPGEYLILVRPEHSPLFEPYGLVHSVSGLPVLPNEGTTLRLLDPLGKIIDEVSYTPSWHTSTIKRDGGWTLERIYPGNSCALAGHWTSATDPSGGTPGRQNSVFNTQSDLEGPRLLQVWPDAPDRLLLTFDERLSEDLFHHSIHIEPDPGIQSVFTDLTGNLLTLVLENPLQSGVVYRLKPTITLTDCIGNEYTLDQEFIVGLPEKPEPGDLVINEILFNPPTDGADFVELFNASGKFLAANQLLLANMQPGKEETRPIDVKTLIHPGQYIVFTAIPEFIHQYWTDVVAESVYQTTTPAWLNENGNVTLFGRDSAQLYLIDQMDYNQNMHFELLRDVKGKSLERLNEKLPSNDPYSWHTAAAEVNYATPTRQNSQWSDSLNLHESPFRLKDDLFSPNGDGDRDLAVVEYRFKEAGMIVDFDVYDRQGRLVKRQGNTNLAGRQGVLTWAGDTDGGTLAGPGVYILLLQSYNIKGEVKTYKLPVVLALELK